MKRVLAIWLPNWPIQNLVTARPEFKNQAVILYRATRHGRHVAACSNTAHRLGVCEGMPVAEAAALVRQKSDDKKDRAAALHLEADDPRADHRALQKLAEWCHQYSPCVGLEDRDPPETLLLDATGIAPLFGSEQAFVEQVARGFQQFHLTARFALADTVGAAWAVSHYGCRNPGVAEANIVESGGSCVAVQRLPIAALRLPPAILETLGRLGFQQIAELLLIPRVELQARLGTLLLTRFDQVLGTAAELICPIQTPLDFTAQWLLEHSTDQRDAIKFVIEHLVKQLAQRMAGRGEGALQLTCQLDCRPAPIASFEVGLFRPTAKPQHLLELIGMQMEHIKLPGPVGVVLVRVTRHARLEARQQELFDQEERKSDSPQVAALVDRLTGRLGRESVVRCVLQSDAQPEKAYRLEPLVDHTPERKKPRSTHPPFSSLDRPLHLLQPPLKISALAVMPGEPPFRFRYDGHDYEVARRWGPERIETGWWRRHGVQRDYYRVETKTGHRFWLFRQIPTGAWFLHGIFD